MAKNYNFRLDDSCADWYDYHFNDVILRNDIVWRSWRDVLQRYLNEDQLHGRNCALCGVAIRPEMLTITEYVGGFKIVICSRRCETTLEQDMRRTIDDVEELVVRNNTYKLHARKKQRE